MLRLIGAALIFLAGSCTGIAASAALNRRVSAFEQMERLVVFVQTQIRYSAAPIWKIIRQAAGGEFSRLSFLQDAAARMEQGEAAAKAWKNAIVAHRDDNVFTKEDFDLLIGYGSGLGSSDIAGQLLHCETYRELFRDRLQKARAEAQTKGKLYMTLGVAGGIGVALLLY